MKILVTGSAGFIGFHLSRFLLDRGNEVIGLDNFCPYYDVSLKEARNKILEKYDKYKMIRADLCDTGTVNKAFSEEKFDKVVNLAAQAGVRYSLDHPHDYINSNIVGFLNILEACRHNHVKRLVYASSSSVYGLNTKLPFSIKDRVDSPASLYAATKRSNELMAYSYSHLYKLQTVGLRFFTVYGPWGRPDMAMWLFTNAIIDGKPIRIFNNGKMQRDFTYVDDIVNGITNSLYIEKLGQYEVFNLGNNHPENLMDIIGVIEKELGTVAEKEMLSMQPGDIPATYADIERSIKILNYKPETLISEGVPKFIKWYCDYHKCLNKTIS